MTGPSPIAAAKAVKNAIEIQGMRDAHIRDAVAICELLAAITVDIEQQRRTGAEGLQQSLHHTHHEHVWDEQSASHALSAYRADRMYNRNESFATISAVGPNAAKAHYTPTDHTVRRIDSEHIFLLDSGGQYLDGTTDVTRTFHFGKPTDLQRETYTRVLMGAIDMATLRFASGTKDIHLSDIIARRHLLEIGLNYNHGTGHGIGTFLNVHEMTVGLGTSNSDGGTPLREGMFMSIEPGYYEPGSFGVRIENIVLVTKANTPHRFGGKDYLTFEPITLVPLEPRLIKIELLSVEHRKWLNRYNARVREYVGNRLQSLSKKAAFKWMVSKTAPIPLDDCPTISATKSSANTLNSCHSNYATLLCLSLLIVWFTRSYSNNVVHFSRASI